MIHRTVTVLVVLEILWILSSVAWAQVINSKHNLSVSGPGTVKATTEQEICVFCHVPHNASPAVPLWDHALSSVSYSQYTSATFASTFTAQYPNASSKLCLSCHDGTIAIGAITTGARTVTGGTKLDPDQSLSASASSNIGGSAGSNLMDDHPISFTFNHAKDNLYTLAGRQDNMKCTSCHDPHTEYNDPVAGKFLLQNNANSQLCLVCHNAPYWTTNPSVHQSSAATMPAGMSQTGYGTVAQNGCESCHKPHTATNPSFLLKGLEQATCDGCHRGTVNGGNTAKVVSDATGGPFAKMYRHPTYTTNNEHAPQNASPVTNSPTETSANLSAPNRHAECQDCHNPHAAKSGLHATQSNAVSNVLSGTWGIEPVAVTRWTQPTTFTRVDPATKEYQICMKCHSYYGLGATATGPTTVLGPSGTMETDIAFELNTNNYSAHPVEVGLSSQTGSYAPKPLAANQMSAPWNTNLGVQTMYCSDCHGNDASGPTDAQGPHGSNRKYMLKGSAAKPNAVYWPTTATDSVWTLRDVSGNRNSWSTNLFCVSCHPLYSGGWYNRVHSEHGSRNITINGKAYNGIPCVTCHVVIPHGAKHSRLMSYSTDISPYNYADPNNGNFKLSIIAGFRKAAANSYSESNCYIVGGCSGHHNSSSGTYD